MRYNIIGNIASGHGVTRSWELLRDLLTADGHDVRGVSTALTERERPAKADVNVFLQSVRSEFMDCAPKNVLVPNARVGIAAQEFDRAQNLCAERCTAILCKTEELWYALKRRFGAKAHYTGWFSYDLFQPHVVREQKFLCVDGSPYKCTDLVIKTWSQERITLPLTVLGGTRGSTVNNPHVTILPWSSDREYVARLFNQHAYHLCLSSAASWDHSSWEALSCGAYTIGFNYDETPFTQLVPRTVSPAYLTNVVRGARNTELLSQRARNLFLETCNANKRAIRAILCGT